MLVFSGSKLAERRRAAGLSREQVAVTVGRSFDTIATYERGEYPPRAAVLGRLASALDCDVSDFYSDDESEAVSA